MSKAVESGTDPYLALLDFRNTPTEGIGMSPAQGLFGRRTKTLLPTPTKLLEPLGAQNVTDKLRRNKSKQEHYYNQGTKELVPLKPGDSVHIKPSAGRTKKKVKAEVDNQVNIRSYKVTMEQGQTYQRNRRHLRLTPEAVNVELPPPILSTEEPKVGQEETIPTPQNTSSCEATSPTIATDSCREASSSHAILRQVPTNQVQFSRERDPKAKLSQRLFTRIEQV